MLGDAKISMFAKTAYSVIVWVCGRKGSSVAWGKFKYDETFAFSDLEQMFYIALLIRLRRTYLLYYYTNTPVHNSVDNLYKSVDKYTTYTL